MNGFARFWPEHDGERALAYAHRSDTALALVKMQFNWPSLLAQRLERHSCNEASGSKVIAAAAAQAFQVDMALGEQLNAHADDEARHSAIFHGLSKLCDPSGAAVFACGDQRRLPGADEVEGAFGDNLPAFICSTHVAELRNLYLFECYENVLDHIDAPYAEKLRKALASVHADEKRHAGYTRDLLRGFLADGQVSHAYLNETLFHYASRAWWELGSLAREAYAVQLNLDASGPSEADATDDPFEIQRSVRQAWKSLDQTMPAAYSAIASDFILHCPPQAIEPLIASNRELLSNPAALADYWRRIAHEEACGSALVRHLADTAGDGRAEALLLHAKDERIHARMYAAFAAQASNASVTEIPAVDAGHELGPDFDGDWDGLLCSIHFGEIRNLVRLGITGQILHPMDDEHLQPFKIALSSLEADEARHVCSTADMLLDSVSEGRFSSSQLNQYSRSYGAQFLTDTAYLVEVIAEHVGA